MSSVAYRVRPCSTRGLEAVQRADLGRLGAGEERLAEDPRAAGGRDLAGVAVDVDEDDARRALRTARSAGPPSARIMNVVQIGSAACVPLRPSGWLSSSPTQTTVSSSGVKPTNQASRRSLVVPDLPAASSVKPAARAPAPVPSLMTLRIMFVTRNVVSGRAMLRAAPF